MPSTSAEDNATAPIRQVDHLLSVYGESHRNPTNELIHYLAIPLIVFSLIGVLHWLHPYLALFAIAASVVYYAKLSTLFMIIMTLFAALCLYLVGLLGDALLPVSAAIFVISWVFQFIGHKIEGKKPSFFEDLQYLLVGPLFVVSKLFTRLGVRW